MPRGSWLALIAHVAFIVLSGCSGGGGSSSPPAVTPSIQLSAPTVSFLAVAGGVNPPPQSVAVSNVGSGTLAAPSASIAYTRGDGWLTANVAGSAAPYSVSVQPAIDALSPGTYSATVSVSSSGAANSPQSFVVSVEVQPPPALGLSTTDVSFTGKPGGANPAAQSIAVTNTGGGSLATPTAAVTYSSGSGWLTATLAASAGGYTLSLQPNLSGLAVGTYEADVQIRSANASNSPQTVRVTLDVSLTWTVFVYGHADHNLSYSLYRDIVEMNGATIGPKLTVIVAADWSAGRTLPDGTPFPTGTEWYRIVGAGQEPVLLGTDAEVNSDDPANLQAAAEAVFAAYPADRYGVILWDHGGAWAGGFGGDENDTPDDPSDDGHGMSAAEASAALTAGAAAATLPGTRPLEFVAFDTCLMAGNEVAFEFQELAKVYVADAEIDFGDGWDYTGAFTYLSNNPAATAQAFAANEVAYWDAQHAAAGMDDDKLRSHVAIDLALFSGYTSQWATLSAEMVASPTLDWYDVARAQFASEPGYGMTFDDPVRFADLRDAGQFLDALSGQSGDPAVAQAAQDATTALDAAVIASSSGSLRATSGQAGVHFEAPLPASWANRRAGYVSLSWDAMTGWSSVLDVLSTQADTTGPVVVTALANAVDPTTASPPALTISSADADTAEGRVYLAEAVGDYVLYYGIIGMGSMLPNTQYEFVWDGSIVGLADDVTASEITLLPWIGGASPMYVAPGILSDGSASEQAYAILDSSTPTVSSVFLLTDGRIATFDVDDFRGLTFTPVVLEATTGQWLTATPLTIPNVPNASLEVYVAQAAPGEYGLLTSVVDVWGNVGEASDGVTVSAPF